MMMVVAVDYYRGTAAGGLKDSFVGCPEGGHGLHKFPEG